MLFAYSIIYYDRLPNHSLYQLSCSLPTYLKCTGWIKTFTDKLIEKKKHLCICIVRDFFVGVAPLPELTYPLLMFTALFFPLVSHSRHVSGGDGVCYWIPFFLFPPPVCFPLTVQNVTHKAFPNVLNLGNFSPFAGSRGFSWQSVVPWSLRCDSQFLFFCDQRVWSDLHIT